MGGDDIRVGADGVGVVSITWGEFQRELMRAIGARVAAAVTGDVEVLGLRFLDAEGRDALVIPDGVVVAGFRRTAPR